MSPLKFWRLLGVMLILAGCTAQPQAAAGFHFTGSPSSRQRLSPEARANRIAFAYNAGFMRGGMSGVIHDVDQCCQENGTQMGPAPDGLRDCMELDYTAYNIDQVEGQQINGASLPFFTNNAERARLAQYGPAAQFDSAAHMLAYLKDMHQLVQRYLVHDWKERSGHCAKNVTDSDCSLPGLH